MRTPASAPARPGEAPLPAAPTRLGGTSHPDTRTRPGGTAPPAAPTRLGDAALDTDRLEALAGFYAANLTLRPRFTKAGRWARLVLAGPDHEAWLLAWLPGQGTELHDHGGVARPAAAAVAVVSGALTEYTVRPGDFPGLTRKPLTAGDVSAVDDRTVHAMRNDSAAPALSLHVYSPGLDAMRTYLLDETGLAPSRIKRAGEDW